MMITENIQVEGKVLASGGFADVRRGKYMGYLVAVKTLRVAETDDFAKIRKVRITDIFSTAGTRSRPSFFSNSARRSSSGAQSLIHTF